MHAEQFKRPQQKSPYKFLDYYDPEDADLFFGRDREIRQLEQKFYNSRLIVLHGESGTGKTSLIRAGLMPRLSPEEYAPVYVRVLEEPLRAIQRELSRQLHPSPRPSPQKGEGEHPSFLPDIGRTDGEFSDLEISLAPGTLQQRIKDFLGAIPNLADSPAQRALIASAGLDHPLEQQLQFGLPQGQFVELLVSVLSKYGQLADGRQALEAVLEVSQQYVGQDRKVYCETLLHTLRRQPQPLISSQPAAINQSPHSLAEFLLHATTRMSKTVVIVLDQFEEFFLRFPEDVRCPFEAELGACLVTSEPNIKVLISLRTDYFGKLAEFEDAIPQIFTHQVHLLHLTEAQALAAVIKPPQLMGMAIDEAMVQIKLLPELLSTTGGIEPPLLQIVCDALYQNAKNEGRNTIGMADYEAIGDVNGALRHYLDEKLRQFGQHQSQARAVLKALVTTEGTKQAVFLPELSARISSAGVTLTDDELQRQYLDKFVNYRLVRVDEVEGRPRYELSHDYLARHIEAWIAESEREVIKVLELIDRAYETYRATNVLLERSALQMIKPVEGQLVLPPEKHAFVARSQMQVKKQRRGLWLKVAAALMFVALVVGGIFGYQAYQQYQEAFRQKEIAEQQKEYALKASKILTDEVVDKLHELPGTKPVLTKVLEQNAAQLAEMYALDRNDPRAQREQASNLLRLGNLWMVLGDTAAALRMYQQSLEIRQQIVQADPTNMQIQSALAASYTEIGDAQWQSGDKAAALRAYEQGLEIRQRLAQSDLENMEAQIDLTNSYIKIGDVLWQSGDMAAAWRLFEQSLEIRQRLAQADPANKEVENYLANNYERLGNVQWQSGDMKAALRSYEQGLEIRQRLAQAEPGNIEAQRNLALSYMELGDVQMQSGNMTAAVRLYGQSLEIAQRRALADQANMQAQRDLSISYEKIGDVRWQAGDNAAALRAYEQSLEIVQRLAQADPANMQVQDDLCRSYRRIGEVQRQSGDTTAALQAYQQDLEICQRLTQMYPADMQAQSDLRHSYAMIGEVQRQAGDMTAALQAYEQSLEIAQLIAQEHPEKIEAQDDLARSYERIGDVQRQSGDTTAALQAYEQRLEIFQRLAQVAPADIEVQREIAFSYEKIGNVQMQSGDTTAALQAYEQRLAIFQRLAQTYPTNMQVQRDLSGSYEKIGDIQIQSGDMTTALQVFEQRLEIWQRLVQTYPTNMQVQRELARSYEKIGVTQQQASDTTAALQAYEQSQAIFQRLVQTDQTNMEAQRDLSGSYERIGDVQQQSGNTTVALHLFEQSLEIRQQIVQVEPTNMVMQADLARSYLNIGELHQQSGDMTAALQAYEQSLEIWQQLVQSAPVNMDGQYDYLLISYFKIGGVQEALHQPEAALQSYQQALPLAEKLAKDPDDAGAQTFFGYALWKLGELDKAADVFAGGLKVHPKDLYLLRIDVGLAFVQGDLVRCQARIATVMELVHPDSQEYALMPFYAYLANPSQGWQNVLKAITELQSGVQFVWDFSTTLPALERLDEQTQQIAKRFIAFFEGKVDLLTLKAKLAEASGSP